MGGLRSWVRLVVWFALAAGFARAQVPVRDNLKLAEIRMHDPWIVADKSTDTYYMYEGGMTGTASQHRSGVIAYKSKDLASWSGPYVVYEVADGGWADPAAGVCPRQPRRDTDPGSRIGACASPAIRRDGGRRCR